MKKLGLKDIPIKGIEDEALGLTDYADALSDFIETCETPLTISIQGDWGSGKTSMMNIIKGNIDEHNLVHGAKGEPKTKAIWFNTWQYSQFNLEGFLAISLISYFAKELGGDDGEKVKKILGIVARVGKAAAITAASLGGMGEAVKEGVSFLSSEDSIDSAMQVVELKEKLKELVDKKTDPITGEYNRIVVFIDDLDRLIPAKAVDFLEVFKLFLDLENCVFVLACDYNVVMQGLQQKFGLGEKELKGKSFFDKIIQLPFTMPVGLGDRQYYIGNLLDKIDASYEPDDLQDYEELVDKSVGFNPRNMKRIFNSLLLLNLVAKKKNLFDSNSDNMIATETEKQKVLFAILCMQIAYEPVYSYFIRNTDKIDQSFFDGFINYKELMSEQETLSANYPHLIDIQKELFDDKEHSKMRRLSVFIKQFYSCIHLGKLKDKEKLLPEEKDMLVSILSFSAITSVQAPEGLTEAVSDKMKLYFDFFTSLLEEIDSRGFVGKRNVKPSNIFYFATGKNSVYYNFVFNRDDRCKVEVSFESDKEANKMSFDALYALKNEIENEIGEDVSWERMDDKRSSRIAVYRGGSIFDGKDKLEEVKVWGATTGIKLYNAIDKRL